MVEAFKVPLVLSPQPEGGYVVTSPLLPELVTEGDSVAEAVENVKDALAATLELYEDLHKPLPASMRIDASASPIWFEGVIARA
ncbi:MAG: type II toxin-antitoxin system HicB family antitoxin [Chloroflexota bacterium]|nr:type II toxin-antitoxin system HicB family antitoxin [Chloroflexota bacterium]